MKSNSMKVLAAAAIASLGMVGQAHALTAPAAGTSGSLFLYVFEDRQDNPAATNSAIFDLGLVSAFDTAANFSLNLGSNTTWASYVSGMTAANVHWGVFGSISNGGTGTQMFTTATAAASIGGAALNTAVTKSITEINLYNNQSVNNGFSVVTVNDLATGTWDDQAGYPSGIPVLTGKFGDQVDFYKWTSTGTKATSIAARSAFATDGDADYWTLSSTGELNYVATVAAPVPEADAYGLMALGLGLVGLMARRRAAK